MNLGLYFRSEISVESMLDIFQQIAAQLQQKERLPFQLTAFQDLEASHPQGYSLREEIWEAEHSQLWFRVKAQGENTDLYNIQFSLEVTVSEGSILCQLFDSSYNPWPKEISLSLQIHQLSQFDTIRHVLQQEIGASVDETDDPKNAISNIESLIAMGHFSLAYAFTERCWNQHQLRKSLPDQWWIYFDELRRSLLERLGIISSSLKPENK
ncbi:MAG: hypothetical protein AABZ60_05045 [Planctomycetota bacterium]